LLHLLDANVLIDAQRDYYPIKRVPEFWEWLAHQGVKGQVKIPLEVYEEIEAGMDDLALWAKQDSVQEMLLLDEDVDVALVSRVTDQAYASNLAHDEVEKICRHPFLVAYALAGSNTRGVVTTEVSKPKRQRANRHLPDVCAQFGITCYDTFALVRTLNFSTSWRGG
jgi:hypothetical protein